MEEYRIKGLKPAGFERGEAVYWNSDILMNCLLHITQENYFYSEKVKIMTKDLDKATAVLDEATKNFSERLTEFAHMQTTLENKTKQSSGKLRDTTNRLNESFVRLQKQADFNTLERYVVLLERAEKSLSTLADLQQSGKLDKIFSALK